MKDTSELKQQAMPDFTIDGKNLSSAWLGIPEETDTEVVYQADAGKEISLADVNPSAGRRFWFVGDDMLDCKYYKCPKIFPEPGLYRVRLCRDSLMIYCVSKYIHVRAALEADIAGIDPEEIYSPSPVSLRVNETPDRQKPDSKPAVADHAPVDNHSPITTNEAKQQEEPLSVKEKSSNVTKGDTGEGAPIGFARPAQSASTECVEWRDEKTVITLRPRRRVQLNLAYVYADTEGVINVSLRDNRGENDFRTSVMKMQWSSFGFANLLEPSAKLEPGQTYTLTIAPVGEPGKKPRIANFQSCGLSRVSNPDIEVEFINNHYILFDLKYFKI